MTHPASAKADYKNFQLPRSFLLLFLSSSSECTGITRISEDSSEIAFLLVENYQLTAPVGLRIGREFLGPSHTPSARAFHQLILPRRVLEKSLAARASDGVTDYSR
jgi:hypothetical protein